METLSQLIVFDDLRRELKVADEVYIVDAPKYPYRGILLDTSRNYVDKKTILRTIEGMAMSKLNTFHWHITDSQSFPYVSRTWPKFVKYGSYTPTKIYTPEMINEVVEYALVRGIRVLPEFDAPAHVGEGWQWVSNHFHNLNWRLVIALGYLVNLYNVFAIIFRNIDNAHLYNGTSERFREENYKIHNKMIAIVS